MIKTSYNSVPCYELFSFSDDYKLCLSNGYNIDGPWTDWTPNILAIVSKNNNKCLAIIDENLNDFKTMNDPVNYINLYLDGSNLNYYYDLICFFVKEFNFDPSKNINHQFIELIHKVVNNLIFE